LLSPPVSFVSPELEPERFGGFDFYYFKLHGLIKERFWYGDGWTTALSLEQVRAARFDGSVVFVANCFGISGSGLPEVLPQAFLDQGARAVVAGPGENFARRGDVFGADELGRDFRRMLALRVSPQFAFRAARGLFKRRYSSGDLSKMREEVAKKLVDVLEFKIFEG
jgi:hypothetical protein